MPSDRHLSDESLLGYLDGELKPRNSGHLSSHLENCPACQARFQTLREAMEAFLEFRGSSTDAASEPPNGWRSFEMRISQLASESERAGAASRLPRIPQIAIAMASLVLLFAVEQSLLVRENKDKLPEFRLTELDSRPTSIRELAEEKPVEERETRKDNRAIAMPPPPGVAPPTAAELSTAAIAAQYAIHRVGACLRDSIEIVRNGQAIRVEGVVDSSRRRQELLAALAGIPRVQTAIAVPEDIAVRDEGANRKIEVQTAELPLESHFRRHFGEDASSIARVSDQAVSLAQTSLKEVWALRRLAHDIRKDDEANVDADSRRLVEVIVGEHVKSLALGVDRLNSLLRAVLTPLAQNPGQPPQEKIPGQGTWRSASLSLSDTMEDVDRLVAALFAGAELTDFSPEVAAARLLALLAEAEGLLQSPTLKFSNSSVIVCRKNQGFFRLFGHIG